MIRWISRGDSLGNSLGNIPPTSNAISLEVREGGNKGTTTIMVHVCVYNNYYTRKCCSISASEGRVLHRRFCIAEFIDPVMTGSINFRNTKSPM